MEQIKIQTHIAVRVESIWNAYTSAEDIMQWNQASEDWHCIDAINDLRIGGKFKNRMEPRMVRLVLILQEPTPHLSPLKK